MRELKNVLAITAIMGVVIGGLLGRDAKGQDGSSMKQEKTTAEGTLVDSKCYGMMRSNTGNDHQSPDGVMKGCAAKCAKDGIPVGVLQANGKVLILAAPAKAFAPYMANHVRVVGLVPFDGTIIPEKIEVRSADGKWKKKISTFSSSAFGPAPAATYCNTHSPLPA